MVLGIDNDTARTLFLDRQGLTKPPAAHCTPEDVQAMVETLGFVQIDSIRTVERAHHMILRSRNQNYRPWMVEELLEKRRTLFEHWTHDASIIPSQFFPHWHLRFKAQTMAIQQRWQKSGKSDYGKLSEAILNHVKLHGPTLARDLRPEDHVNQNKNGWWDWHPAKTCLEYLWQIGRLAICHRQGFQKAYDLAHSIIPTPYFHNDFTEDQSIDWACRTALDRLGFGTAGEISRFWALVDIKTAQSWLEEALANKTVCEVEIAGWGKKTNRSKLTKRCFTTPSILESLTALPSPSQRLRILSPFDPLVRDRKRLQFLFGVDFRIEIFVPEPKRTYGYYVFPMLEGNSIVGRIDVKALRKTGQLVVNNLWWEAGIKQTKTRIDALERELRRLARYCECHYDFYHN